MYGRGRGGREQRRKGEQRAKSGEVRRKGERLRGWWGAEVALVEDQGRGTGFGRAPQAGEDQK